MQTVLSCGAKVPPQGQALAHRRYQGRKVALLREDGRYGLDRMSRHRGLCVLYWTINPGLVEGLNRAVPREDQMRTDRRMVELQVVFVLLRRRVKS